MILVLLIIIKTIIRDNYAVRSFHQVSLYNDTSQYLPISDCFKSTVLSKHLSRKAWAKFARAHKATIMGNEGHTNVKRGLG